MAVKMDKRQFSIELGKLVMRAIAEELDQDSIIDALDSKIRDELCIREHRRAMERTY